MFEDFCGPAHTCLRQPASVDAGATVCVPKLHARV